MVYIQWYLGGLFPQISPLALRPSDRVSDGTQLVASLAEFSLTPITALEILLTLSAMGLWVYDGKPGLSIGLALIRWLREQGRQIRFVRGR